MGLPCASSLRPEHAETRPSSPRLRRTPTRLRQAFGGQAVRALLSGRIVDARRGTKGTNTKDQTAHQLSAFYANAFMMREV